MDKKKTILQVADKAGLSIATVSRVLNNHPYVREATRAKVLKAIDTLGFERNNIASGLRSRRTHTIGMIVPRISMFFHAEIITAVQQGINRKGFQLIICQSGDDVEAEAAIVKTLIGARVDAVVIASTLYTVDYSHYDKLARNNIPVICYDRVPLNSNKFITVTGNDKEGGYLAASHIIEKGCKKIARISGPLTCNLYYNRRLGFEKAMAEHSLKIHKQWMFHQELTYENAIAALEQLFSGKEKPDALICDNDTSAIAAIEFAKINKIKVPNQLKVIGYSNDPRSTIITPSVTTINQYPREMGEKIVDILMTVLHRDENALTDIHTTIIPVELIKRQST